jgi:hypothetical protein
MKLLVKVVGARYADAPQVAIVEMTDELFSDVQKVMSNHAAHLETKNPFGEYFLVNKKDLSSMVLSKQLREAI